MTSLCRRVSPYERAFAAVIWRLHVQYHHLTPIKRLFGCSSPPFALLEADEQSGRGTVALVSEMAGALASGLAGLAKNVVLGRESGYRAGEPP